VPTPINTTNLGGQVISQLAAGDFFNLLLAEPALPGDFNHAGSVDAADYVGWRKSLGQTGSALAADGDQDYQVDADDYDVWRDHFGMSLGPGSGSVPLSPESLSAAVPEPPARVLLLMTAAGVFVGRRSKSLSVSKLVRA
jgi:hypothetical protein